MHERDPLPSVDFAPVPIRPRDPRRRPDAVVLATVAVAIAIGVAILKPWDGGTDTVEPSSAGTTADATAGFASPQGPIDPADPDTAVDILSAIAPRDVWGLGVIALAPGTPAHYVEDWQAVEPTVDDPAVPSVYASDAGAVAIRLSAPRTETPLDVRAWARGRDGRWRWLAVDRFGSDLPAADLLLPPPTVSGRGLEGWPPGRYRFELLDGASIRRVDLTLGPVPPAQEAPVDRVDLADGEATTRIWPDASAVGLYVVEDSVVHPLLTRPGEPLTAGEAWLSTERVASDWRPRASAIGVLLPPGPTNISGEMRRIEPDATFRLQAIIAVGTPHPSGARTSRIEFAPEPRAVLPSGLYELDLAWDGPDGHQTTTWYVRLRPGPTDRVTALLRAARRYAAHAATPALILSGAGRREPDADTAPVRVFPMAPSIGCGSVLIDQTPAVLGFGHEGPAPVDIVASILGPEGRRDPVPLRLAGAGVAGLTLVEPARGATFAEGIYTFTKTFATGFDRFTICLGTSPFAG